MEASELRRAAARPPLGGATRRSLAGGWLAVLLLAGVLVALRAQSASRAARIRLGEGRALVTLEALAAASQAAFAPSGPHPGLEAILPLAPTLKLLRGPSDGERAFAQDENYVYGLGITFPTKPNPSSRDGWFLRAWPQEFGVTGDAEFCVDETGQVWEGPNETGRSGTEVGFPPAFPEPTLGQPGAAWWRRESSHR